jgi:very-short-patch-repair endonuclease
MLNLWARSVLLARLLVGNCFVKRPFQCHLTILGAMPAMAQSSAQDHGFTSQYASAPEGEIAETVLGAPEGSVLVLAGIDGETLRLLLDAVEPDQDGRRALFVRIVPAPTTEAIVEQVLDLLADTARRVWPIWFTDVSFHRCSNDTLGRLAANAVARMAAEEIAGLSLSWVEMAARLALENRPPRVSTTLPAVQLAQLSLAISRYGLTLVADVTACTGANPAAVVHALEWIAQHLQGAVVALFPELPPNEPPFDRILYGARIAANLHPVRIETDTSILEPKPWIAPWQGLPHPLSEIEQRLAKALRTDSALSPLFGFNQFIETIRGSRPKVDLLWTEGRLVVELDGYGSHGNRAAFMYDRHRDYELTISGYTVLRLSNDEIADDIEKAIEKIRDLVALCRTRSLAEG